MEELLLVLNVDMQIRTNIITNAKLHVTAIRCQRRCICDQWE